MPSIPRLPNGIASAAVPLAVTLGGAFLLRRLIGAVLSVMAMLAVGRLLLTALKVDLALAERRTRPAPGELTGAGSSPATKVPTR